MTNNLIYEGLFLNNPIEGVLEKEVAFQHVTTEFRPSKSHEYLYGQTVTFKVVGYNNDRVNEGIKVQVCHCANAELLDMINSVKIPHVTLSLSNEGKAKDTANLNFVSIDGPTFNATFGGFVNGQPVLLHNT